MVWWLEMSEEFRNAAGFGIPPALLQQREPEQMFRMPLMRVARSEATVKAALIGHVRAFAELKALCVERVAKGLCSKP